MRPEALDALYQDIVLDHYKRPRNRKAVPNANMKGEGFNPFCGDRVVLTLEADGHGRIVDVGVTDQGCAISQASASMLGEAIKGRTIEEVKALAARFKSMMQGQELTAEEEEKMGDLAVLQGVRMYPVRIKCALLAWSTLLDAIAAYAGGKQPAR